MEAMLEGYGGILGQVIVVCHQSLATSAEDWRKALDKVVPAVIVLRTNACQAFNTEAAGASYATGFVDFLYGYGVCIDPMLLELQDKRSMVLSGGYEDDEDHGEWFLYRGKKPNNFRLFRSFLFQLSLPDASLRHSPKPHTLIPHLGMASGTCNLQMSLINGRWLNNRCCSRSNSQYHRSSNTITEPEAREILGSRSLRHCILLFLDWYWSALLMNSSLYQFFR
uniref:Protease Do-like 7 n=1 Tax=Solanum tuberosum TaxID=4113 RepID=M1B461_SOLTU